MMHRIVHQLELKKKLLLAVAGTAAIVLPVAFGVLHALPLPALPLQPLKSLPVDSLAQSAAGQLESGSAVTLRRSKSLPVESLAQSAAGQFEPIGVLPPRPLKNPAQSPAGQPESGSVQPDKNGPTMPPFPPAKGSSFLRFTPDSLQATNAPLSMLIGLAYDVNEFQVSGPSWIYSAKLEVINVHFPKIEGRDPTEVMNQRRLWLQSFLARDVKLVVHRETKPAPIYELVVSASGPNFHEAAPGDTYANGVKQPWDGRPFGPGIWDAGAGEFVGQRVSMAGLAGFLSRQLGREVVDKTALTGNYDFTLHWAGEGAGKPAAILAAVPHDLGLQLDPQVAPVDMIIIDHAEQGSGSH